MRAFASSVAAAAVCLGAGCTKLVPVELAIVEPCGQDDQALNGVASFRMLSTGATADGGVDNVVAFKATEPQGMSIGLGEKVIISVEGFAEDITVGDNPTAPTVTPKAIGRTVPLLIDAQTAAVKGTILVGKVDTFGGPRDVDGNCSEMTAKDAATPGRHAHTVTYIPQFNKVLIFGGAVWSDDDGVNTETFLKTAEVFDPITGTFTKLPDITPSRAYHTATVLPDGRVLVWGGFGTIGGATTVLGNAQVIDINAADPNGPVVDIRVARAHHTASVLGDLLVIVGGCTGTVDDGCTPSSAAGTTTNVVPSVELLDLKGTLAKSTGATGSLQIPRAMHQAVAFPSGEAGVIGIVGGLNGSAAGALRSVEILQVQNGDVVNAAADPEGLPRALVRHQATIFDPQNLGFAVTGGQDTAPNGALSTTAPGNNEFVTCQLRDAQVACNAGPNLQSPRYGHAMARLRDGTLVVIGGVTTGVSAEVLDPVPGTNNTEFAWAATGTPSLQTPRDRAAFCLLGGDDAVNGFVNQVFYSGGHSTSAPFVTSNDTDIFFGP